MGCLNYGGWISLVLISILASTIGGGGSLSPIKVLNVTRKVPAVFTFGDSIVDPGNNNFILTIATANHPPYGRDFMGNKPTGRFSNGKLAADFIAAGLGVKETVPPFLDPELSVQDLLTGVSFASAGTGYDDLTAMVSSVIPMWKKVELFKTYKGQVEAMVGGDNSSRIIEEAIFTVVAGSNDFIENYFILPARRNEFSVEQYQDFLLQLSNNFIEDVYKLGVRKLAFAGLPPLGCLPLEKTLYGLSKLRKGSICIDEFNQIAASYNTKLKAIIGSLQARLPGIKVVYIDIYDSIIDIVNYPSKYGFETIDRGCCGSGLIEAGPSCNVKTTVSCADASQYVFWDAVHPTQKTYEITANLILRKYMAQLL